MDDVVGNVTASLKAAGLWDETLFLLTSDNGGPSYNAAHTANNYPLRGSKLSDWEGGVRCVLWPAPGLGSDSAALHSWVTARSWLSHPAGLG